MKLKPISLAVFSVLCGYSSSSYSAASATANTSTSKVTTTADIRTTPPTSLVQPYMPSRNMASWRFGVWRNWSNHFHEGIDMSGKGSLNQTLTSDGVYRYIGGSVWAFTVERPGGMGAYTFMHNQVLPPARSGSSVRGGTSAGIMGNRTGYDVHTHYQYAALCNSGLVRYTPVSGSTGGKRATYGQAYATPLSTWGKNLYTSKLKGGTLLTPPQYCLTDPSPYLPQDRVFNGTMNDARLDRYLGNSIYAQYNVLYNSNLPVGRGVSGARAGAGGFARLPVYDNSKLSPDQLANYNMNSVNGSVMAQEGGYNIDGQLVSQQVMASIFSSTDGSEWSTLPKPADPLDITKMSMKQIIEDSATKRFGNAQWDAALVKLSSKAMLNEYLLMEAEGNFLQQQNSRLKNRIEMLLAGMTQAQLFEFNKKIEAMNIAVNAGAVPRIIDVELAQLQGYAGGGTPMDIPPVTAAPDWNSVNKDDLNQIYLYLMKAISMGEATSYDAFNYGTAKDGNRYGYCMGYSGDEEAREEARKFQGGVNVTDLTFAEARRTAKRKYHMCRDKKRLAIGKYQFIPDTLNEFVASKKSSAFSSLKYSPELQEMSARWLANKKVQGLVVGQHSNWMVALKGLAQGWESIGAYNSAKGRYVKIIGIRIGSDANQGASRAANTALMAIIDWHKKYGATKKVSIDPMTNMVVVKDR